MASGSPIVATNLPVIKDILNENNAVLIEPDNPETMAQAIKRVIIDKELAERITKQSAQDVRQYTYEARAKKILEMMNIYD